MVGAMGQQGRGHKTYENSQRLSYGYKTPSFLTKLYYVDLDLTVGAL